MVYFLSSVLLASRLVAASIPGLFPTGVNDAGVLLAAGARDPHYELVQSADPAFPGPATYAVQEGFPIPPWLANGPDSKWIAPRGNQSGGNQEGDYVYRLRFDLTGLDPFTAVITGRWSTDNSGVAIRLNDLPTGVSGDGNFSAWSPPFTLRTGFIDGTNTLEFVVNNAPSGINPTGLRVELGGTADPDLPPGFAPTIMTQPAPVAAAWQGPAVFRVTARGSKPRTYQWRLNGQPVAGATSATLAIPVVTAEHAGLYDVVVSNDAGSVTSALARLALVFTPPGWPEAEPPGPTSRRTALAISEVMYHPAPRTDGRRLEFIELYNSNPFAEDLSGYRLTGDVDFTFPAGTSIAGLGRLVVAPEPADLEAVYGITGVLGGFTDNLPNASGTIRLRKKSGALLLEVRYSDNPPWPVAADGAGHSLVLDRPTFGTESPHAWSASAFVGGSPGRPEPVSGAAEDHVLINELLTHTDLPQVDFLELQNFSPFDADLSGCYLSDDPATNKFRFPDGTRLRPYEYLALDQTQLGFALQADGETVFLISADRTRVIDAVRFGGQANGLSWGRFPAGARLFRELSQPTPGQPNAHPSHGPVVISEVMYHPISDDSDDEYVELHNRSTTAVDLSGWRFMEGIQFTFPSNTVLNAGEYLAVARNALRVATNHPAAPAARILGDFSGQLDNAGERITLARPDTLLATNGPAGLVSTNTYYIPVEDFTYGDGGRWGEWADGGGSSLELIDARADRDLAPNWTSSDESAKAPWTTIEVTGVLDLGVPSVPAADALHIMLLDRGEAIVDGVEVLVGGVNRVANGTFNTSVSGWTLAGTHRVSRWEAGAGLGAGGALRLVASGRGDHTANHLRCALTSPINPGTTATLRARVRWLRGHPEILLRLRGNYLEAAGRFTVPTSLGTPATANIRRVENVGPAITDVTHRPILPEAGQPVRVTARVSDIDGLSSVRLAFRIDPSTSLTTVPMLDDGTGADLVAGDAIFTAFLPGQPAGALVAFRVQATDAALAPLTRLFPADAPARECLVRFGERVPPGGFGTYRFWVTQSNVDFWSGREKMSNEDLDTTFVDGAHRVIYNAGTHYSGSAFTSPGYNSPVGSLCGYDLRVPEDDLFLGERHVTLDWPIRDSTNQREQLMYWFLEQLGLPNLHRRYVHLFVNGVQRGTIYDDTQQPGDDVLSEWWPDDDAGALYKTDTLFEYNDADQRLDPLILNTLEVFNTTGGVKKTARYRWNWRPRAFGATANDFSDLFTLVDTLNAPAAHYVAGVESLVDVEHWTRTFAMNDLASFWDAFGNPNTKNTFLYKPQREGWKLLSWDFDVGLGAFNDPVNAALFPDLADPAMNRFYTVPAFLRSYWRTLEESVHSFFQPAAVTPLLSAKYEAFQAAGIPLASPFVPSGEFGLSITDWIAQRRAFLLSDLSRVATTFTVSGPAVRTTNRTAVTLAGTAPVAVKDLAVNGAVYPATWTGVKTWTLTIPLEPGTNVLALTGLDRTGHPLANASARVTVISTAAPAPEYSVVFNEWMAANTGAVADPADGDFDDWFELYNPSAQPADLSGFWLSDDPLTPKKFVIPAGRQVPAQGFLLVWADDEVAQASPDLHVNFRLGKEGETLTLRDPTGRVVDSLEFGPQRDNLSEGRWPDGGGAWAPLPAATPRTDNARPAAPEIQILGLVFTPPAEMALTWTSAPGFTYRVQFTTSLIEPVWIDQPGDLVATAATTTWTDLLPAGSAARYYRVVAIP